MGILLACSTKCTRSIFIISHHILFNTIIIGPVDYESSLSTVTIHATTNSATTAELRITIKDEDIVERNEDFNIALTTMETRVMIANSTSILILNDDGRFFKLKVGMVHILALMCMLIHAYAYKLISVYHHYASSCLTCFCLLHNGEVTCINYDIVQNSQRSSRFIYTMS